MPSKRQIQANKNNAKKSTGPQTPKGKAVVAVNAVTHGFSAQAAVLPSESAEGFQTLLARLEDEFQPQTALEQSLIRQLADADWRLRRVATFEAAVLLRRVETARQITEQYSDNMPEDPALDEICLLGNALIRDGVGSDSLSKISRHEVRLTARYFKALTQLHKLRESRPSQAATATPQPAPPANNDPADSASLITQEPTPYPANQEENPPH